LVFEIFGRILLVKILIFEGICLIKSLIGGSLDYSVQSSGTTFLYSFLATRKAVMPLANYPIMLGRSKQCLDTLNTKICLQILLVELGRCNNSRGVEGGEVGGQVQLSYITL